MCVFEDEESNGDVGKCFFIRGGGIKNTKDIGKRNR